MRWLLGLILALAAVGTSGDAEAQLSWDMNPPPPEPRESKPKEVATQHTSSNEGKSPAVIEAERRVRRNRISLRVSTVPVVLRQVKKTSRNQTGSLR